MDGDRPGQRQTETDLDRMKGGLGTVTCHASLSSVGKIVGNMRTLIGCCMLLLDDDISLWMFLWRSGAFARAQMFRCPCCKFPQGMCVFWNLYSVLYVIVACLDNFTSCRWIFQWISGALARTRFYLPLHGAIFTMSHFYAASKLKIIFDPEVFEISFLKFCSLQIAIILIVLIDTTYQSCAFWTSGFSSNKWIGPHVCTRTLRTLICLATAPVYLPAHWRNYLCWWSRRLQFVPVISRVEVDVSAFLHLSLYASCPIR